jgi:hypothetical protein
VLRRPTQPGASPRQPKPPPPLFFFLHRSLTGGARPSGLPLPPAAGQPHLPFMAASRYRLVPALPRLQSASSSCSEARSSFPHHQTVVATP